MSQAVNRTQLPHGWRRVPNAARHACFDHLRDLPHDLWPPDGSHPFPTDGLVVLTQGRSFPADWLPAGWFPVELVPLPPLEVSRVARWVNLAALGLAQRLQVEWQYRGCAPPPDYPVEALLANAWLLLRHADLAGDGCPGRPERPLNEYDALEHLRDLAHWLCRRIATEAPRRPRRMSRDEANDEAHKLARKMGQQFFRLSETAQANLIGCHLRTWRKARLYPLAQKKRPLAAANRPSSPKAGRLTEGMIGKGRRDEVLCQLIEAEEPDSESSPLEDDRPGSAPRDVHTRQRL